jgi:AcrR family transcriptional regulator
MRENGSHPGRPRDPRVDDALLRAGLEVFLSSGYHAATLTEIARRAKVSKPAIYRRWPTKADMAVDTVAVAMRPEPIPDTGSIRDDLVTFVRLRLKTFRTRMFNRLLLPVILESITDPHIRDAVGTGFRDYRKALDDRIRKGIAAGQLRKDTDPTRLLDLLMGTLIMPLLFSQALPRDSDAGAIVDQVVEGFAPKARKGRKAPGRS